MVGRNMPRNVLTDILNDPQTGAVKGIEELNKLIFVDSTSKVVKTKSPVTKKSIVTAKKKKRKKIVKRKTTHYLTEEVFDDLGNAKDIIKSYLPKGSKLRASKSRIVESAIKVLLDEFESKGEDSYLVKELLKKKK